MLGKNAHRQGINRGAGLSAATVLAVGALLGGAGTALARPASTPSSAVTVGAFQRMPSQGGGDYGWEDGYNSGTRCETLSSTEGAPLPPVLAENVTKARASNDPTAIRLAQDAALAYKVNFDRGHKAGVAKVGCPKTGPSSPSSTPSTSSAPSTAVTTPSAPSTPATTPSAPSTPATTPSAPSTPETTVQAPSTTSPSVTAPSEPSNPACGPQVCGTSTTPTEPPVDTSTTPTEPPVDTSTTPTEPPVDTSAAPIA